jgi:hypothetical protein
MGGKIKDVILFNRKKQIETGVHWVLSADDWWGIGIEKSI